MTTTGCGVAAVSKKLFYVCFGMGQRQLSSNSKKKFRSGSSYARTYKLIEPKHSFTISFQCTSVKFVQRKISIQSICIVMHAHIFQFASSSCLLIQLS